MRITRRNGKSVLPKLLKEFGFDEYKPKSEETISIIFDEHTLDAANYLFIEPKIKAGEIFEFSTKEKK